MGSDVTTSTVDELFNAAFAHKYVVLVASAILYFEYCLTFSREVDWVWNSKPRITWTHVLFYLNRYLPLFGHIVFLLQVLWVPRDHPYKLRLCIGLRSFHQYFSVLAQTIVGIFLIVRTYALYNGNKRVQFLVFFCAAGALSVGVWGVTSDEKSSAVLQQESLVNVRGCFLPQTADSGHRLAAAWGGLLAFDMLIFLLTLSKSISQIRYGGSNLMRILLVDGAMYFGIMALSCSLSIVSYISFHPHLRSIIVTPGNTLSSIMMSRLLLNLRDPSITCRYQTPTTGQYDTEPIWTVCTVDETQYQAQRQQQQQLCLPDLLKDKEKEVDIEAGPSSPKRPNV